LADGVGQIILGQAKASVGASSKSNIIELLSVVNLSTVNEKPFILNDVIISPHMTRLTWNFRRSRFSIASFAIIPASRFEQPPK